MVAELWFAIASLPVDVCTYTNSRIYIYIYICIIEYRSSGGAANRGPSGMLSPAALRPTQTMRRPTGGQAGCCHRRPSRPAQTVRRPTGGQPGTTDLVPAPPLERTPTRSPPTVGLEAVACGEGAVLHCRVPADGGVGCVGASANPTGELAPTWSWERAFWAQVAVLQDPLVGTAYDVAPALGRPHLAPC